MMRMPLHRTDCRCCWTVCIGEKGPLLCPSPHRPPNTEASPDASSISYSPPPLIAHLQAIFKILTTKIKVSESFGFSVYKPEKLTSLAHHSSKIAFKAKRCHGEESAQTSKLTLSDAKAGFFSVFCVYLFIFSKRYVY